jgi:hypothetical protein
MVVLKFRPFPQCGNWFLGPKLGQNSPKSIFLKSLSVGTRLNQNFVLSMNIVFNLKFN